MCQHAVMPSRPHAVMLAYMGRRKGRALSQQRTLIAGSLGDPRLSVLSEQVVDCLDDEILAGSVLFHGKQP